MGYVAIAITECFLTQISYIFTTRPRNKQKKKKRRKRKERNKTDSKTVQASKEIRAKATKQKALS